jgi:hypothetical protein
MDMSQPLTGNDCLILTPSVCRYQETIRETVDAARAAAVAAAEARCVAVVAEKEAVAAVESTTIVVDKVGLAVEAVKYQSFVQDNSMVTDFFLPYFLFLCRMWNQIVE